MAKKMMIGFSIVISLMIAGGVWYYINRVHLTSIDKILSHQAEYRGKAFTIQGEVTDRTAFFVVLRFFKLRDRTGEMMVLTKKSLPEVKSTVLVTGRIDEAFQIGDQKLLVFLEDSIEKRAVTGKMINRTFF